MSNKPTTSQSHLLNLIREKQYLVLWEEVKYVGYQTITNIDERYLIFLSIVSKFDPDINNNFIHWYKQHLLYQNPNRNKTYKLTDNPAVIRKLARHAISPSKEDGGTVVKKIIEWVGDYDD